MTEKKPWEKRSEETAKSFAAFCIYRDLPPFERSLPKVVEQLREDGMTTTLRWVGEWSRKYDWVKRAEAWDAYLDQQTEQQRIEAWRKSTEQLERLADAFIAKTAQRLIDISNEDIPAAALSKWMIDALKVLRDLRGEPTEVIEQRHRVDLSEAWREILFGDGELEK